MPAYKVNVKWGKQKFEDVEVNTDEPPIVFKAQLFALSGVQPDRQKVMIKGSTIKDDDWGKVKLKDGVMLLMMGSAEALKEPQEKIVFMEDMSDAQLATAMELPFGLNNLGNTCYMNATLQCLRSVPELKDSLKTYKGNIGGSADESITAAMRDLFGLMDRTGEPVSPIMMLQVLHMYYPQFAEKSEHGGFQQQDANECWTELVRCLQKRLPSIAAASGNEAEAASVRGFIDQYFGGEFTSTMKCIEAEEEEPTTRKETFYQLSCFIDKEVKYMATGLKSRLEEHITKNSPSLSRDAQYLKSSKINRLPAYLSIQMVRFYYKEKEAVNAKILKDIKFPMMLDVFEMCTPELQEKLVPMRTRFKEKEDRLAELKASGKDITKKPAVVVKPEEKKDVQLEPYSFPDDPGSNNSGYYELQAVLTHKGRSSSSGHYVGWVRRKGDEWLMYDDDRVTPILAEDVMKLSGGGDWHCAYVVLYGPRRLEVETEEEKKDAAEKKAEEEKEKSSEVKKEDETPMET